MAEKKLNACGMKPEGVLVIRAVAMPADTNSNGDIFGGWILSQMDLGGAMLAKQFSDSRVVTVGVESMSFINPVKIGDFVSCYARVIKTGRTSISVMIETWVSRYLDDSFEQVTHGIFTYVAIDGEGKPTPLTG